MTPLACRGHELDVIASIPSRIRARRPLIHHITNAVAANITANSTIALGASPVMASSAEESADMAAMADVLVLNMGTPSRDTVKAMIAAGKAANARGIPVVFDPVGAGSTPFRNSIAVEILQEVQVAVVRGNAAEIAFLAGMPSRIHGVDSAQTGINPRDIAAAASTKLGAVVAVTGATDYVSDGRRLAAVRNGHPIMGEISGTGCTVTAIMGAFCAVERDFFLASVAALAYAGAAGQVAAQLSNGPGSFQVHWLDSLYRLSRSEFFQLADIAWETLS